MWPKTWSCTCVLSVSTVTTEAMKWADQCKFSQCTDLNNAIHLDIVLVDTKMYGISNVQSRVNYVRVSFVTRLYMKASMLELSIDGMSCEWFHLIFGHLGNCYGLRFLFHRQLHDRTLAVLLELSSVSSHVVHSFSSLIMFLLAALSR